MPTVSIIAPRVSDSARALAQSLNNIQGFYARYRNGESSGTRLRTPNYLINWGCSSNRALENIVSYTPTTGIINLPSAIYRAANKLLTFRALSTSDLNIPIPEFTTNRATAHRWFGEGATKVYCRTQLRGHSGQGIIVARNVSETVTSPLYTKGIDIRHEFRFHVMNGVVFDGVRKSFRTEVPEDQRNYDVRNHAAGSVFVRSGPSLTAASRNRPLMEACINTIRALGLDFGAVDVVIDDQGNFYILEVNTACGLEGTTLERYTRAFYELLTNTPITPWSMGEFTGDQTTTPTTQENEFMNINNATVGQSIVFNPSASNNIASLTRGNNYTITRVGAEVIYIRNDRGRVQGYRPRHFTTGTVVGTPTLLEAPSDGSINRDVPNNSPLRVVLLPDGTSVNVTGTATFTGNSRRIATNSEVTIADMFIGIEHGRVFIGVEVDGNIYRYTTDNFSNGIVETPPGYSPVVDGPSALDIEERNITVGHSVIVRTGAGGHRIPVGTICGVVDIDNNTLVVTTEGNTSRVRIQGIRTARITAAQIATLQAERAAIANQESMTFTIGSHSYRILQQDLPQLRSVLRNFTV